MQGKSQYSLMMDVMTLGERPDIPADCPKKFSDLIKVCWDQNPSKRPDFPLILDKLKEILLEEEAKHSEPSFNVPAAAPKTQPQQQQQQQQQQQPQQQQQSQQPAAAGGEAAPLRKWFRHYKDSNEKIQAEPKQ